MQNSENHYLMASGFILEGDPQITRVSETLRTNRNVWMTLAQIGALAGITSESSVASRIRDLRTEGDNIERRLHPACTGSARVYEYRLTW
jgi:hypothetical protein